MSPRFPYEIVRLAEDIAGGLMVTMPSQKDFHSDTVVGRSGETIGEICNKFFAAREGVATEDRQRIMRFLENMCLGAAGGRLPHRVHARRGLSPGAAHHDCAPGQYPGQKAACQGDCGHQPLKTAQFISLTPLRYSSYLLPAARWAAGSIFIRRCAQKKQPQKGLPVFHSRGGFSSSASMLIL